MGIFDSLFGSNTTSATDAATQAAMGSLTATGQTNNNILNNTTRRASGAITAGAAGATNAINTGYDAAGNAVTNYGGQAQDALKTGTDQAVGTIQGSNGQYAPYVANGQGANGLYADSLGVNGAAGNTAATNAFQAGPGYQWQVDQSTDAAARKAASLGIAGSGNTLDAITRLGSDLANQEYSNWQNNLSGLSGQGLTAANAVSGNNQAAGGIQAAGATTGANLLQNLGSALGTIDGNKANALSGIQTGMGNSLATLQSNLGTQKVANNTGVSLNNANLSVSGAKADDAATNANNGIFSKLIGGITGLPLGGATTGAASTGGFTITPAAVPQSSGIFSNLLPSLKL